MKKAIRKNRLETLYDYSSAKNKVSIKRFKNVLSNLVKENNPEALVIASSINFRPKTVDEQTFETYRIRLLEKAISLKFSPAMVEMAEIFYEKQQYPQAFQLYEQAGALNHAYALKILALNYEFGWHGYEKNLSKANELKRRAGDAIVWNKCEGYNAKFCDSDGDGI